MGFFSGPSKVIQKASNRVPTIVNYNTKTSVVGQLCLASLLLCSENIRAYAGAPTKPYYEYHIGVDNIFKILRIDFVFRGNYLDVPGATKFGIKGGIGFYF